MEFKLILPPESMVQIVEELFQRIRPLLNHKRCDTKNEDAIFNVPQLSKYLNVSPKWIYEQTHDKAIPHYKLGSKQLRFKKKEIDRWLETLRMPITKVGSNPSNTDE
jgi:excisionase family DNA binding protein